MTASSGPTGTLWRTAALLAVLHLSGCYSHRVVPIAPRPFPDPVEVEVEGRTVILYSPRLEGDSVLVGWRLLSDVDSAEVRVPYHREVRKLDVGKTLLLGLGVTLAAATVAMVALLDALTSWS